MFGLREAKMGKVKMREEGEVDEAGGFYSNDVKSFSHQLHRNYHADPRSTNFHHLPVSHNLPHVTVLAFRVLISMLFGNLNEGVIEADLSKLFYVRLHFGVDKHKSNNSSVDFSHFVEKNRDVFARRDCFSDGVNGYNVDNSGFGNVFDHGVYDFGGYSKRFDSQIHYNFVFPNLLHLKDHMSNLAGARFEKENGYQGYYSSMMHQFGLDYSPFLRQRNGGFMENIPTPTPRVNPNSSLSSAPERLEGLDFEDSFILQRNNLKYIVKKGSNHSRSRKKKGKPDISLNLEGFCENDTKSGSFGALSLEATHNLLEGVQGYIYYMAKDQCGCQFLHKIFDEGNIQDVQTIFTEIIDHVVELMMDQFGNYFVQKLLDVCNEEQRMQIVAMVTERPRMLVCLCLNTHGTCAVQKLIETIKTRQQISLVIYALESGFLDLIKDVNGNHVIQRCLKCLSNDDNKFVFSAATKLCVEIATHQHECCVLNRCISHATYKDQEKLVKNFCSWIPPCSRSLWKLRYSVYYRAEDPICRCHLTFPV